MLTVRPTATAGGVLLAALGASLTGPARIVALTICVPVVVLLAIGSVYTPGVGKRRA